MAGNSLLFFLSLVLLSSFSSSRASSQTTYQQEEEKQTLLQIKSDWGNPLALHSWNDLATAAHLCNWTGIQCSTTGFVVTGISLYNQNLTEPIPAAVCNLKDLSYLDVSNNYLPGPFPTALYNCSALQYVDLSQNLFVGVIPSDIHRLPSRLTFVSLSGNNFTGDIPPSIGRLPSIQTLLLENNLFNGSFPLELGNLSTLQHLELAYNPFKPANIPPEFGNMTALTDLFMAKMNLVGQIADSLGNLSQLAHLDLSMNSLSGRIPSGIWMLANLQNLYLFDNRLTGLGGFKGTIGALGLAQIDVSMNHLTGPIPDCFGKMRKLQILFMYYNNLSGDIPASIGMLPDLTDVRLFSNNLTGVLPPELGKHSNLWNLEVDDNFLSGELPEFLCAGQALSSVVVSNNNLTGKLPASLGACPTLDNLLIHWNGFSGEIPVGIWSAANLTTVIMHHNDFTGTLPNKLPEYLEVFAAASNLFSGEIPRDLAGMSQLLILSLEGNQISGPVPPTISSLTSLIYLNLSSNKLSGEIPAAIGSLLILSKLDLSNNQLTGEMPIGLVGMPQLLTLSLEGNQISGSIPSTISSLRSLTYLNLSGNKLSGNIPAAIGSLLILTSLDLSNNLLTGEIPPEIGNLQFKYFNLSSNLLSGAVPASLLNQAYNLSFLSNPCLCSNDHLLNLPACGSRSDTVRIRILLFLILGVIFFLLAAVAARVHWRRKKDRGNGDELVAWKLTNFQAVDFTETDIIRGLSDENLIGTGGSGMVYRVAIGGRAEEMVAVKKIWNSRKLDSKLEKEFEAEVQILGSIRHANIVKLLCSISSTDSKSKLLIYEYMGHGSLHKWLHGSRRGPPVGRRSLDWPTRLGIAMGAAQGLCYMHHSCSPPIIHRDVKSSNILLDSEFGAKIADFGLARMLVKAGEPDSVSTIAGTFGYMAPECAYLRKVNEKMDVYSFGVVLLELVTGREANGDGEDGGLAEWAWRRFQEGGTTADAIDEGIKDPSYLEEIEVVFKLGLICTGSLALNRPSMKEVLQVLFRYRRPLGNGDSMLRGS